MSSPTVNPPPPRDITKEMLQTLQGLQQTAGPQFDLESLYQPKYAGLQFDIAAKNQPKYGRLNLDMLAQSLLGYGQGDQHHPGQLELGRRAANFQREGDIADVQRLGPQATQAFLNANPYLESSLNKLNARTDNSQILNQLNQQASRALASQGQLSPEALRDVEQQSRAAFADRGMVMGNQSLASELFSRDAAVQQRMAAAQQLASGVQGLNQQQNDFIGRAAQINASSLSDPFQAILGRSSGAAASAGGASAGGGYGGSGQMIGTGAQMFDPMNAYAQDIYNTNYNAAASANIANANNEAAGNNAKIAGGAAIAGAVIVAI